MLITALAFLTCLSAALTFWRWMVGIRFPLHRRVPAPAMPPPVTLLKPLKGADAQLRSCLESWLQQDYRGPVQILFGVASADDPAGAIVRELLADHPLADAQLVLCRQSLGANAKVSTLTQLQPLARHDLIVVSDADVRVPPDLLNNLEPLFDEPSVGLAHCFYRLANPATLAMHWEAIAVNADFWSEVLQARSLQETDFALGAVMAVRRSSLEQTGGFASLADYLADDYQLGNQVARAGGKIAFSTVVVECWESPMHWKAVWKHQLRWARTIRVCQPLPFFFSLLNNASLWPLVWLGAAAGQGGAGQVQTAVVLGAAALLWRVLTALDLQWRLTQSTGHFRYGWLVPVKDLLNVAIWALAFTGGRIEWRGDRYQVLRGGKLIKRKTRRPPGTPGQGGAGGSTVNP